MKKKILILLVAALIGTTVGSVSAVATYGQTESEPTVKSIKESLFEKPFFTDCDAYTFGNTDEDKYGTIGRVFIPSLGIDTPLYKETAEKSGQDIIDDENSALVETFNGTIDIGDHAGQGFDALYNAKPGETKVFVGDRENAAVYKCIGSMIVIGNARGSHYTDLNGRSLDEDFENRLIMSTCYDNHGLVSLTIYERIR